MKKQQDEPLLFPHLFYLNIVSLHKPNQMFPSNSAVVFLSNSSDTSQFSQQTPRSRLCGGGSSQCRGSQLADFIKVRRSLQRGVKYRCV